MPHIVSDEQKLIMARGRAREAQKREIQAAFDEESKHIVYLDDKLVDPTNSDKQLGHGMFSSDFEKRAASLLPSNIAFIDNPFNSSKKAVVRIKNITTKEYDLICPYERGYMPEHSVMQRVYKEVPDPDFLLGKRRMERSELPAHELTPDGYVYDPEVCRPGFKRVEQIGREVKRGWRTILLYLLKQQLVTLGQIERIFGSSETRAWSGHTGKQVESTLPW